MTQNDPARDPASPHAAGLAVTPLDALHRALGAKMAAFAGYDMPIQYPDGVMTEHRRCRESAALFDVSHMGQVRLTGADRVAALEALVPGDIAILKPGRTRYSVFTNDRGGILDDLMITNAGDHLFLVINAACKDADIAHLRARLRGDVALEVLDDRALIALQGPAAAKVLARLAPEAAEMTFMSSRTLTLDGQGCFVTRSGYTGEDGYEISVPAGAAPALAERLLAVPEVAPAGLGARDSLRLEAGLCLYGSDIDTTTTPIEADLAWVVNKRRRAEGGFPGAAVILDQLAQGAPRKRVGILPQGKAPARAGTPILDGEGTEIGVITSGGFGPSAEGPVALGYVPTALATPGCQVQLLVRGTPRPAMVTALPFVPHRYHRG